jgi:hypothetical protein
VDEIEILCRETAPMWTRRNLIETAVVGATGVLAAARHAGAQDAARGEHQHGDEAHWTSCADICEDCAKACNNAFHHCVTQAAAGKGTHAPMAQIAADCAAFCSLSAQMLQRKSTLALLSCSACAGACKYCAQECDKFESSQEMKLCADACRRCEESCRKMVEAGSVPRTSRTSQGAVERGSRKQP